MQTLVSIAKLTTPWEGFLPREVALGAFGSGSSEHGKGRHGLPLSQHSILGPQPGPRVRQRERWSEPALVQVPFPAVLAEEPHPMPMWELKCGAVVGEGAQMTEEREVGSSIICTSG